MTKIKLFRNGRFVGLVNQDFHYEQERKVDAFWEKIELEKVW